MSSITTAQQTALAIVGTGQRYAPSRHTTLAPTADTRVADQLRDALTRAEAITDPWRMLVAKRLAYRLAIGKAQAALDTLGTYEPDMDISCWLKDTFRNVVAEKLARGESEVVIDIAHDCDLPTLVSDTASVITGRVAGHDGWEFRRRDIGFDAELEFIRVNGRRVAVYHIRVK